MRFEPPNVFLPVLIADKMGHPELDCTSCPHSVGHNYENSCSIASCRQRKKGYPICKCVAGIQNGFTE